MEVLMAQGSVEVVVRFLWCREKKKFVVEREKKGLTVVLSVANEDRLIKKGCVVVIHNGAEVVAAENTMERKKEERTNG
jgi:hypothetical protein